MQIVTKLTQLQLGELTKTKKDREKTDKENTQTPVVVANAPLLPTQMDHLNEAEEEANPDRCHGTSHKASPETRCVGGVTRPDIAEDNAQPIHGRSQQDPTHGQGQ
ncbi:hypothetical protein AAFF_G00190030 [Aldrovandia affinis]|uniref:Uncharacterized protein n=1 Tax=Aldrovandia affinis TaxID=143900 RepID=A0AAD7RJR7_9TELE|nr:hypothetical protein AAFF_G00190030 [Aldrovandia affinis]